ncbi:unnamed protein product [Darwinula stevensoni]|uniref:Uncharacterized protein n=1 Tax=Darwinula stevensoni TaxID=69355 RepID=A0A7R9FR20_9CRUS|nr:unnamed protein product [Darwinula stevensoni]CAG0900461.1 unnamed protein product [Darwinula stevensoni]
METRSFPSAVPSPPNLRSVDVLQVGASLFASNIGSGHFVGLAGAAAANGIAISAFEINAMFVLILLGWVFVPVYMSSGVFTMPEYLRKRFGRQRIRVYLSVLAIILYVFTKISADLFAGAIFLEESMKLDMYSAAIALLVLAGFFTIGGGLTAVIWMDSVQTVIIVIGCFILTIKTFIRVGGYQTLVEDYFDAYANVSMVDNYTRKICNAPPDYAMHIFRDPSPGAADIPWTGLIFGVTVSAVWYWCSDLVIVQRALAAKDMIHAKSGCIFAAYLKFLPLFLLVFPGMAARVIFPDEIGCSVPRLCEEYCGSESGCFNRAYPKLVVEVMPDGLRGLMLSVILASLMNCLTSTFNSSSTIFSIDIYRRFRKNATDMELLVAGRCFVVGLVALSIAWLPIIQTFKWSGLFDYIQSITSFLSPPICAVNVLGLLWERVNEAGAFWGLMCGLIVGLIRFALEFGFPPPTCGNPDTRPEVIQRMVGDFHYLHFGFFLFLFVCLVTTVISLLTKPIDRSHLPRLTFGTRFSRRVRIDLDELDADPEEEERQRQKEKERLRERVTIATRQHDPICTRGFPPGSGCPSSTKAYTSPSALMVDGFTVDNAVELLLPTA